MNAAILSSDYSPSLHITKLEHLACPRVMLLRMLPDRWVSERERYTGGEVNISQKVKGSLSSLDGEHILKRLICLRTGHYKKQQLCG